MGPATTVADIVIPGTDIITTTDVLSTTVPCIIRVTTTGPGVRLHSWLASVGVCYGTNTNIILTKLTIYGCLCFDRWCLSRQESETYVLKRVFDFANAAKVLARSMEIPFDRLAP
jgi:hypothetical protein